jgi:phage gpG-like protein
MPSIQLQFTPWRPFLARKNNSEIRSWLERVAKASEAAFKGGMGHYPPASAPGAWPNIRTGNLRSSIRTEVTNDSMTIGSNMRYSRFLREGTSRMARRKMSDDALKAGMSAGRLGHWVQWSRV